MKKNLLIVAILLATTSSLFGIEQTICFSQKATSSGYLLASLGDEATLNGGKCEGTKLSDMNKKGWKLIQVVTNLDSSFGMVFEKIGK